MCFSCEDGTIELPSQFLGKVFKQLKKVDPWEKKKKKLESGGIGHQNKVGNFDLNANVAQKDSDVSIFL